MESRRCFANAQHDKWRLDLVALIVSLRASPLGERGKQPYAKLESFEDSMPFDCFGCRLAMILGILSC